MLKLLLLVIITILMKIFFVLLHYRELLTVLSSARILPLRSSERTKSQVRIREKFRREPRFPILDIYGIKVVVNQSDVTSTVDAIREHWPMPEEFPWGDERLGNIKTTRTYGNLDSDPSFNTTRMNIMFDDGRIAEIQITTPEQEERDRITRKSYLQRQKLK